MNRLLPPPPVRERGQTMIMAAIAVPIVVATAALGIGAAMVRSADSEVQRTANLAALAEAANAPMQGRPTASGVPSVPSTLDDAVENPLPPTPGAPADPSQYTAGGIYNALYSTAGTNERDLASKLHLGIVTQPVTTSIGSSWTQGCSVAEAQFAPGRAKIGRAYAAEHDASGNPVVPHCATSGIFSDGTAKGAQRIYLEPEMESTGAYRLERCLQHSGDCASQLGVASTQAALSSIGSAYSSILSALGVNPSSGCLIDPTAAGCMFNQSTATSVMGATAATAVSAAIQATFPAATGIPYSGLGVGTTRADLQTLGGLLFGKTSLPNVCGTALGPASGQTACAPGVNMASMAPSTLTPRVRAIVHHAVDFPFVPSITGASVGDFAFSEMALARRSYKNAVVLPTVPSDFTVNYGGDTSACLRGKPLLTSAEAAVGFVLNHTIAALNAALTPLVTPINNASSTCGNAVVDGAVSTSDGFPIDLNGALSQPQTSLIAAASALNTTTNQAVNTVVAPAVGRNKSECATSPPAAWCVDVGGQAVRDLQDIYNPPGGGSAPTASDVIQRAHDNNEDIEVVSLGKWVPVSLGTNVITAGGTISALTYWIPVLDVVPATVSSYNPTTKQAVLKPVNQPHGLYKAVLLDATADLYPLCTTSPSTTGACYDQPPA